ncbi:hypothetical protein K488DRAFT_84709 [Vararia minispora EC-137]|uniref:Uncharacterized protein n=1 Tax=Vararia minispora EC-137 TaxID=1314806 RepID=A0ACB8QPR6_9AGAM|nr:hypothetical protein K488DRAFT_84709 [Vararia minispora EC-137]
MSNQTTSATQAKDRQYAQLAMSLNRLARSVGQTVDMFEHLQVDLDAMRTLAGLHAAQFMAAATQLSAGQVDDASASSPPNQSTR